MRTIKLPAEERVDIEEIKINLHTPMGKRMEEYIRQIKNPYAFRCGETMVDIQFSEDGVTLQAAMAAYLEAIHMIGMRGEKD